ncbi:uncharacterized protein NPIL_665081 [Nephila pilipes]|uniref:Uncharacterized protein n=1 Tax=Nephila pilipes TaxID=299642 RepID=A0A8X6R1B8_NEPPI|nr:uncharacterized protein NPIL_665081 [Nephila pilipes]
MAIYVSADHYDQRQPREQSDEKIITPKMMHTPNTCRQISRKQFHSEQPCTVNIGETAKSPCPPIPPLSSQQMTFSSNLWTSERSEYKLEHHSYFLEYCKWYQKHYQARLPIRELGFSLTKPFLKERLKIPNLPHDLGEIKLEILDEKVEEKIPTSSSTSKQRCRPTRAFPDASVLGGAVAEDMTSHFFSAPFS